MQNDRSIIKNIGFSAIKTVSTLIFPVLTFSYASRKLLAEGMGSIEYAKSWVAYFTLIAMLGVVNYGTRECAKVRDNRKAISCLASEILMVNLIASIIAYASFFIFIFTVDKFSDYRFLLVINSLSIILTVVGMDWLYNAEEDYKYITIRTCIVQIFSFVFMLIFVRNENDTWKYALIQVFSTGGSNVFNFWHSKKYIDLGLKIQNIPVALKKHLKPLLFLFLMILSVQVFTHMDSTMLGWISGDTAVGYYSAASKITGMLSSVLVSCTVVLMPRIAYYEEKDNPDEIKELISTTVNMILMISIPMAVGVIFISDLMVKILSGDGYFPAVLTTQLLSPRIILSPLNTFIITHLFVAIRKESKMLVATTVSAVSNLCLNAVLIPRMDQNGAAMATVAAEIIELVIVMIYLGHAVKLQILFKNIWQYIASSMVIPAAYFILSAVNISSWSRQLLLIVVASMLYFSLLYFMKNLYVIKAAKAVKLLIGRRSGR